MTNQLVQAIAKDSKVAAKAANKTTTTNGAKAFKSTLSANVDFFGTAGSSRGKDLVPLFVKAFNEDQDLALRNLMYLRDVRGGSGERDSFRKLLVALAELNPKVLLDSKILEKTTEVGRWDDLLELVKPTIDARVYAKVIGILKQGLIDGNGLCAKWLPRKGDVSSRLRLAFGWSPKFYRKTLVTLTKVVETQMCAKDWDNIQFSHVPSKAMTIYTKAFKRNAQDAFQLYKEALTTGEAKVNAAAVFPHDVYKALLGGSASEDIVFSTQWNSLPDYMNDLNVLPMIDTSYSMTTRVGGSTSLSCMDVAVSLGTYISQRTKGDFKNTFLTFNTTPTLEVIKGNTLREQFSNVLGANWGGSTNIDAGFKLILDKAVANKVPQADMPKMLIILSDMQFNGADRNSSGYGMAKQAFKAAGYELPLIVFWNLAASGNVPVTMNKEGVCLVSGFSSAILKAVLGGDLNPENFTPKAIMLSALMDERYAV